VSVVDAPPGRDFAGPALGEFRSRPGPKRLARAVLLMSIIDAAITYSLMRGSLTSAFIILPMVCVSIAAVGFAVRSAIVRIDVGGIQWGWGELGFRIGPARIKMLHLYERGLVVIRTSRAPWYLARHDWGRFEKVANVCEKAGLALERKTGRAPLRAQMQAYGVVLDGLMVVNLIGSGLIVVMAALR
tara:strand:- start:94596 stop:95156 length:561 start_codon:yes stop_codon:yes gene_type:complete